MKAAQHTFFVIFAAFAAVLCLSLPVAMASGSIPSPVSGEQAFIVAGIFGIALHYVKKRIRGEVVSGPLEYFVMDSPGASAGSVIAFAMASAAVLATGTVETMSVITACMSGFTTGWTCNSAINKGL